jgi:cytochrome c oxidase cbb3-type subunit 4
MDINDMRIAVTVISLLLFIALVAHTWSRRRNAEYESAALLPFAEDAKGNDKDSGNTNENRGEKP